MRNATFAALWAAVCLTALLLLGCLAGCQQQPQGPNVNVNVPRGPRPLPVVVPSRPVIVVRPWRWAPYQPHWHPHR